MKKDLRATREKGGPAQSGGQGGGTPAEMRADSGSAPGDLREDGGAAPAEMRAGDAAPGDMRAGGELPGISATRKLVTSAILVALASALSWFTLFRAPYGGSVTICSMIPIMMISFIYPFKWSLGAALAYSLIQMMMGFYAPPVETIVNYALTIFLDYIAAFGVLCLSGPIYRMMSGSVPGRLRLMTSAVFCIALRFVCHFISGMIIWKTYASPGQPAWLYSLLYNGSYMLLEGIISGVVLFVAGKELTELFVPKTSRDRK